MKIEDEKYECPKCGAVHQYQYPFCANCRHPNPFRPSYEDDLKNRQVNSNRQIAILAADVHTIRALKGKDDKKRALKSAMKENRFIIHIIRYTYDPNIQLGFTSKDLNEYLPEPHPESYLRSILKLRSLKKIGKAHAIRRWNGMLLSLPDEFQEVANGIIDKDLNIGLSVKDINQVLKRIGEEPIQIPKRRLKRKSKKKKLKKRIK